ncbi:ribosome modulation factor [Glutamicibacter nicotianae]|uniref:ribosome modulation factor n=1 Tax=Glutamicibacter nicotianae TaxID=37929 RepID=UPI003B3A7602
MSPTSPDRSQIQKAQEKGYAAYLEGQSPRDCPFDAKAEQDLMKAWCSGYAASRTDRARENTKTLQPKEGEAP